MNWLKRIFGNSDNSRAAKTKNTSESEQPRIAPSIKKDFLWDYLRKVSSDNDSFFDDHKDSLPQVYAQIEGGGKDPILMLVALEQEKWCALLALLYKRPDKMLFTPETITKDKPCFSNNGKCDVYVAPRVNGQLMQSAIYGVEREWLISEFRCLSEIPPIFISLIEAEDQPSGMFTVVSLCAGGMNVKHLPIPAISGELKNDVPIPSQSSKSQSTKVATIVQSSASAPEKAAVQKLVWTWKSSGYGRFETEEAHDDLKKFPNPTAVCSVFTATLLKGEWASEFAGGSWPIDFSRMLGEIGDPIFLDDLFKLYRTFEANSNWKRWSGYFAVAILHIEGGFERMRNEIDGGKTVDFIFDAITCFGEDAEGIDYGTQLTEEEKSEVINKISKAKKENTTELCNSLRRVGLASIETLLMLYRSRHPKEAAAAICDIPDALDYLSSRISTKEIEKIIACRYEYTGMWSESLVRGMGKLKTPLCIKWLKDEASAEYIADPETTKRRRALIKEMLAG